MSEATLPVGPGGSTPGSGRNRMVYAVIGLGVLLALGAVMWLLVFSGGGGSDTDAAAQPPRKPRPTASPTEAAEPAVIPAQFEGSVGRNPFKPLVFAPDRETAAPTGPTGPETPPTGTVPLPLPQPWPLPFPTLTPTPGPSASPTPIPTPTTPRQHFVVALTKANPLAGEATFVVNQKEYSVALADGQPTFGPVPARFSLLSVRHDADWGVEETYAEILYGDERFVIGLGTYLQFS